MGYLPYINGIFTIYNRMFSRINGIFTIYQWDKTLKQWDKLPYQLGCAYHDELKSGFESYLDVPGS